MSSQQIVLLPDVLKRLKDRDQRASFGFWWSSVGKQKGACVEIKLMQTKKKYVDGSAAPLHQDWKTQHTSFWKFFYQAETFGSYTRLSFSLLTFFATLFFSLWFFCHSFFSLFPKHNNQIWKQLRRWTWCRSKRWRTCKLCNNKISTPTRLGFIFGGALDF